MVMTRDVAVVNFIFFLIHFLCCSSSITCCMWTTCKFRNARLYYIFKPLLRVHTYITLYINISIYTRVVLIWKSEAPSVSTYMHLRICRTPLFIFQVSIQFEIKILTEFRDAFCSLCFRYALISQLRTLLPTRWVTGQAIKTIPCISPQQSFLARNMDSWGRTNSNRPTIHSCDGRQELFSYPSLFFQFR